MQIDIKVDTCSMEEHSWRGLTLTDAAARQIKLLVGNDPSMLGLRLSVKQSGCAGFSYVVAKATRYNNNDVVYEQSGARLYVPLKAMQFLDGTELDYVQEGLNSVFKFNNPKAQHACGCGESFSLGVIKHHGKKHN
ncbi:Protein sufA [Candidatus Moranella endobia PCVAL]|uniref:Putative FeS assembly scaffold SufA n=1 Tax=Moranella endobia (strain PCIT) TaxID=903503 RepID=F7XY25_MOREP|nr:Fe-S cluster assembly scaffold SufA [Candidatus Moranella endobia]AEI75001.1 putative FeS assembly scaffold SufA [Candidatus Moranella endobia PCIT]AGJ61249.1 Protein sufA [Candidatus Moranella endobia PCVAL]